MRVVFLVLAVASFPGRTPAIETDNFHLPPDEEFADLGDFLEALHTRAIEAGVARVNSRIERALNLKDPARRDAALARWHQPEAVAMAVSEEFGVAPYEMPRIQRTLSSRWARESFPGKTVRHYDLGMNLRGHFILDPRALFMVTQASTLRACGVYFGADKLVHFHQLGRQYYERYHDLLRKGADPDEARRQTVHHFARGGVLAESNGFGTVLTGVYSNADMAANYLGFLFLLNVTEPVLLHGAERAPLVVRCGVFWRVNDQVRPQSGWFRPFISDHLNEALNPNLYDASMRPHIRRILEERAERIVEFYTVRDGRPADPDYYDRLMRELATLDGRDYGHSGRFEDLMNLGNTCLPAVQQARNNVAQ